MAVAKIATAPARANSIPQKILGAGGSVAIYARTWAR
jgi:hypothetical protein